jgi:hypothetical protein
MRKNKEIAALEEPDVQGQPMPPRFWPEYVYNLGEVLDANIHYSVSKNLEWDHDKQIFRFTLAMNGGDLGRITQSFVLYPRKLLSEEIKRLQDEIMTWRATCASVTCPEPKKRNEWIRIALMGGLEDFGMKYSRKNLSAFKAWDMVS